MKLKEYLKDPKQSWIREALINHRLSYDLKLSAAYQNYNLIITRPDIDLSGFDLVLDDGENNRKVQIKTVFNDSQTKIWNVRKLLLSPSPENLRHLGFATIPPWIGLEGGFILATVGAAPNGKELEVRYNYTDFYTIAVVSLGFHGDGNVKYAEDAIRQLVSVGDDKIEIKKSLLMPAQSSMHLLALLGLRSSMIYNWQSDAMKLYRIKSGLEHDRKVTRLENSMRQKIEDVISGQS